MGFGQRRFANCDARAFNARACSGLATGFGDSAAFLVLSALTVNPHRRESFIESKIILDIFFDKFYIYLNYIIRFKLTYLELSWIGPLI